MDRSQRDFKSAVSKSLLYTLNRFSELLIVDIFVHTMNFLRRVAVNVRPAQTLRQCRRNFSGDAESAGMYFNKKNL